MTLGECIEAVHKLKIDAVCYGDSPSPLHTTEAVFVILSSIAIIATAIFAWRQLRFIRQQIVDARDGVGAQITTAKENQRLSATLQLLIHLQSNDHWIESRRMFISLRESKEGLKKHAGDNTKEALAIRATLNQYELVAIGIRNGILDKHMYHTYYRGTVLKDWLACAEFVDAERKDNPRYWIQLEALAKEFQTED
jgi:hypothetical protein